MRRELFSKATASAFLLAAAISIACELRLINPFLYPVTPANFAAYVGEWAIPSGFLFASVLVFLRARFAYALGLAASAIALLWFIQLERGQARVYGSS